MEAKTENQRFFVLKNSDGTRLFWICTMRSARDFESNTSANSITPALTTILLDSGEKASLFYSQRTGGRSFFSSFFFLLQGRRSETRAMRAMGPATATIR